MHDLTRPQRQRAGNRKSWAVAWILALAAALTAVAAGAAPAGFDSEEAVQLLAQLEEQYEVLTLAESWVLRPTTGATAFDVIEIRRGSVAVDGERRSRDELRELVGDSADLMHSLAELADADAGLQVLVDEDEAEPPPRRRRKAETDTRISFASSLTVEEHESVRDVVVIGGSLEVLGEIDGDAVAVGGSVDVQGEVDGNVTAVGGSVSLGPEAVVDGDVAAIGGSVHRDPEAKVRGGITELSLGDWEGFDGIDLDFGPWWPGKRGHGFAWVGLAESITTAVMLSVFVLLMMLIARGYVGSVADRAAREPWKAGLVGLIAEVLFLPAMLLVFIILGVSVIGIPLAILWIIASPLGLVLMFLMGYSAITLVAGRKLQQRFQLGDTGPYIAVLLGIALIQGWTIIGEAFSFLGGPIRMTAWLLILLGFLIKFVAWTVGLGSVLLHGFAPLPATGGAAALPAWSPRPSYPPPPPPPPTPAPPPFEPLEDEPEDEDQAYAEAGASSRPAQPKPPAEDRPVEIEDPMYYAAGRKKPPRDDEA